MALTTSTLVRAAGGLNDADAYRLFRVADDTAFNTLIDTKIAVAAAWLRTRAPVSYASSDADTITLFTEAESLVTLHFLVLALKSRRVEGTHWALDQEGSERFEELIDVEYLKLALELLEGFIEEPTTGPTLALPTFSIGAELATTGRKTSSQKLGDILLEADDFAQVYVGGVP